jgi:hypothetical protein
VESNFYRITLKNGEKSLIVEDTLANIEGAYADIFANKISQDELLTPDERAKVAVFVAAMLHRTRPHRDSMRNMVENVRTSAQNWKEEYQRNPEARRLAGMMPPSGDGDSMTLEDIDAGLENFDEEHVVGLIPQIVSTAQVIFDMKWGVWKLDKKDGRFVTSDNPFVVMRPASIKKYGHNAIGSQPGLLYEDAEVTLPLSKDRLLLAGWILDEDSYISVPPDIAEAMNQRTIIHSSQRIIASSKEELEEIKVKYPPKQS